MDGHSPVLNGFLRPLNTATIRGSLVWQNFLSISINNRILPIHIISMCGGGKSALFSSWCFTNECKPGLSDWAQTSMISKQRHSWRPRNKTWLNVFIRQNTLTKKNSLNHLKPWRGDCEVNIFHTSGILVYINTAMRHAGWLECVDSTAQRRNLPLK